MEERKTRKTNFLVTNVSIEMPTTVETLIFISVTVHKKQSKLMGLVHAMQSNGPLPQVKTFRNRIIIICWRLVTVASSGLKKEQDVQ